uniref:Uncharacterized protein n=1 Tax=Mustela putorius furo TaxID=9669 RepID=M3Z4L8_MUSPF
MKKEKKPGSLSNFRDKRTVSQQTKWPAEVARMGLARPLRGTRRAPGAGGRRDAEEVLRPPPARCPGRSTRLVSHLAAPGPVCAEPGIPPAAQTAPAPSLPPPRFPAAAAPQGPGRTAVEPGPIFSPGAHSWRWLEGGPRARAHRGKGQGPAAGVPKPGRRDAPTARALEQCGLRGTRRGFRPDGGAVARGEVGCGEGGGGVRRLGGPAREPCCGTEKKSAAGRRHSGLLGGSGSVLAVWPEKTEPGAAKPRNLRGVGAASGGHAGGDNEMDGWHEGGAPELRTSPGLSYLFKRRPPPALPRSRGLTRRVVSDPPVAGEGSMSPRPQPSRPHRGRERRGRPCTKSERPADPRTPRRAAGPPE